MVLAGLLWRGAPYSLLTLVGQNPGMQLFSSQALLDELADVLTRPSPTKRLHQINMTAHAVLADYVRAVTALQPQPLPQPVCRDPDDDQVLALALLAQADELCRATTICWCCKVLRGFLYSLRLRRCSALRLGEYPGEDWSEYPHLS